MTCADSGDEVSPIDDGSDIGGAAASQVQGHAGRAGNGQAGDLSKLRPLPHPARHRQQHKLTSLHTMLEWTHPVLDECTYKTKRTTALQHSMEAHPVAALF